MAERLPTRTEKSSSTVPSSCSASPSQEVSAGALARQSCPVACRELDSIQTNSSIICNVSNAASNNSSSDTDVLPSTATAKSKNRAAKTENANADEWVEQDETGVYLTLTSLPGGLKCLKRVRFRYVITISVKFTTRHNKNKNKIGLSNSELLYITFSTLFCHP